MKITVSILLLIFVTFLITPTIISVIKKSTDTSLFYSFSEEEYSQKEIKAVFDSDFANITNNSSQLSSSLIHFENLSKHDKISSKIFIPPPDQV